MTPSQANVPIVALYRCGSPDSFSISIQATCLDGTPGALLGYGGAAQ